MLNNNLIRVDSSLVKPASITCTNAFKNDPYVKYIVPDEHKRPAIHYVFEYYLRLAIAGKEIVFTTSPECEGVAIWEDTRQKWPLNAIFHARNPLLSLRCGVLVILRLLVAERHIAKIKKQYAPETHLYLALLAVRPESQGKGFASILVGPMLTYADKENLPCYLETQNTKNVSLYEHFGFKVVYNNVLPHTTVPFYGMLREVKNQ